MTLCRQKAQRGKTCIPAFISTLSAHQPPSLPQALSLYKELLSMEDPDPLYFIYSAACSYYMGLYKDAELAAMQVRGGGR